jgi:uncharacterized membrane protein
MKTAIAIVVTLGLAAVSGCRSSSPRGGGVSKDEEFKIVIPTFDMHVKQGEVRAVAVSLRRGAYFKQHVKLHIQAPPGISVDPTDVLIKASESPEVQFRVATTQDTALGAYRVTVNGTPNTGRPTSTAFTVKVVAP